MEVTGFIVNVNSEDPHALGSFYRDVVGLPVDEQIGEHAFKVGGSHFLIDGHSDVKGKTGEPARVLFNLFIDDIEAAHARLEAHGVPCIRTIEREPWGGIFSTFVDPDGNYFQLVEFKPE